MTFKINFKNYAVEMKFTLKVVTKNTQRVKIKYHVKMFNEYSNNRINYTLHIKKIHRVKKMNVNYKKKTIVIK